MGEEAARYTDQIGNPLEHPVGKTIDYLRHNWESQGLPENWSNMPGTGFWMERQMDKLSDTWNSQDLSFWLSQDVRPNVQGYMLEYLAKTGVFPIQYDIHRNADGVYLTAPMYGGQKLLDVIDHNERHGALVEALNTMTAFLADDATPQGSLAVICSVRGPSNIVDPESGKPIIFPDSQRYILQKSKNNRGEDIIVGFTIKTDALYSEERAFIEALTGTRLPNDASPEDYVRTVALIRSDEPNKPKTFSNVVGLMQQVHERPLAFVDKKGENQITWEEIFQDLGREDLWDFPLQTKVLMDQYEAFAQEVNRHVGSQPRDYLKHLLREGLAATLLEIGRFISGEKQPHLTRRAAAIATNGVRQAIDQAQVAVGYGETMKVMQASGGCSNTGEEDGASAFGRAYNLLVNRAQVFLKSLAPRIGITDESDGPDGLGPLDFKCEKCGGTNSRPLGDYNKGNCRHCGVSFKPC